MSYSTGEALILATLRLNSAYNANNTSRGNWLLLNSGADNHYVILRPGESTYALQSLGGLGTSAQAVTTYTTELMCYQRYVRDGQSGIDLQDNVETVIAHMEKYRGISDTTGNIIDAGITGIGQMQQVNFRVNQVEWLLMVITMQWQERRNLTLTD